jgi:hypothetical protein|tara:strand:- start:1308 stop:1658 length:351 start_codon:yes stop_codon:yes gene_type:complete
MGKLVHVAYNDSEGEFALSFEAIEWLAARGVVRAQKLIREMGSMPSNWGIDASALGLERHSSILILCISELGPEKVSSTSSYIRVRKIETDKYMIRNVAGIETVLTPEDIIWVEVS